MERRNYKQSGTGFGHIVDVIRRIVPANLNRAISMNYFGLLLANLLLLAIPLCMKAEERTADSVNVVLFNINKTPDQGFRYSFMFYPNKHQVFMLRDDLRLTELKTKSFNIEKNGQISIEQTLAERLLGLVDSIFVTNNSPLYELKTKADGGQYSEDNILQVAVYRNGACSQDRVPLSGIYDIKPTLTEDGFNILYSKPFKTLSQILYYLISWEAGESDLLEFLRRRHAAKYENNSADVIYPSGRRLIGYDIPGYEKIYEKLTVHAIEREGAQLHVLDFSLEMGKDIIPILIEHIDDDMKRHFIEFEDYYDRPSPHYFYNYIGIKYAYLIEFMMKAETMKYKSMSELPERETWSNPGKFVKIFKEGILFKKDDSGEIIEDRLTLEDMVIVKGIYQEWWEKNKDKSLSDMRKEWKETNGILSNSNYIWR